MAHTQACTHHHAAAGAQRGVTIVEAMVALAIMGFGMLAVVGVQATMRLNADVAKQRSEATRFGQEEMERWRAFTVIDDTAGQRSFAQIVASAATDVTGVATNTTYRLSRAVVDYANPPAKALTVTVSWRDRADQPQQIVLRSLIAAAAPALSGTLAVRPGTAAVGPVRRPLNRHPSIPVLARDFGDGRSAFVPPGSWSWRVLVFDNVTGRITGICDLDWGGTTNETITPSDVASCSNNTSGQLVSGFVRVIRSAGGGPLSAADVEDPAGPAFNLSMILQLSSSGHPHSPFCFDDVTGAIAEAGTLQFATYACVVYSNSSQLWSGIVTIFARAAGGDADWRIDVDGNDRSYRVCRYTSAHSDAETVPNAEHPRNYRDVGGNLTNQNFVVIPAAKLCPTDGPANPAAGDFVNTNTLQHQPDPSN